MHGKCLPDCSTPRYPLAVNVAVVLWSGPYSLNVVRLVVYHPLQSIIEHPITTVRVNNHVSKPLVEL